MGMVANLATILQIAEIFRKHKKAMIADEITRQAYEIDASNGNAIDKLDDFNEMIIQIFDISRRHYPELVDEISLYLSQVRKQTNKTLLS